jgi:hypothetical protein
LIAVDSSSFVAGVNASLGNVSDWNVSQVVDMSYLFSDLHEWFFKFEPRASYDLSKWDVSKVTNMSGIFIGFAAYLNVLCKSDAPE